MMRLILSIPLLTATVAGLGACGQSAEAEKATYRNELLASCTQAAGRNAPAGANVQGVCTCIVDRYVANTPVDRLRTERSQSETPPAARQARIECMQEEMQRQARAAGLPGTQGAGVAPETAGGAAAEAARAINEVQDAAGAAAAEAENAMAEMR